jgi:hypothetical protein
MGRRDRRGPTRRSPVAFANSSLAIIERPSRRPDQRVRSTMRRACHRRRRRLPHNTLRRTLTTAVSAVVGLRRTRRDPTTAVLLTTSLGSPQPRLRRRSYASPGVHVAQRSTGGDVDGGDVYRAVASRPRRRGAPERAARQTDSNAGTARPSISVPSAFTKRRIAQKVRKLSAAPSTHQRCRRGCRS